MTINPSHANSKNAVFIKYLMGRGEDYSSTVQTQSDIIASHYNHSILSITMGRIVLDYPSHANSKYLVGS